MADAREIIAAINTAEEANAAAEILPNLEHALTSKKECGALLNERAKEIGLVWDKTNKKYISSEAA
jgi:hypothetical protein